MNEFDEAAGIISTLTRKVIEEGHHSPENPIPDKCNLRYQCWGIGQRLVNIHKGISEIETQLEKSDWDRMGVACDLQIDNLKGAAEDGLLAPEEAGVVIGLLDKAKAFSEEIKARPSINGKQVAVEEVVPVRCEVLEKAEHLSLILALSKLVECECGR